MTLYLGCRELLVTLRRELTPWSARLFKLETVTCAAEGSSEANIRIPGLTREAASRLERWVSSREDRDGQTLVETGSVTTSGDAPDEIPNDTVIYQMTKTDLVVTLVARVGVVLGVAVSVGSAIWEHLGSFAGETGSWVSNPLTPIVVVVVAVVVAFAYGVAKLHGALVQRMPDGSIRYSYGWLEKRQHLIMPGKVFAATVSASPVDQILRTKRLHIVTQTKGDEKLGELTFPAMPTDRAIQVLQELQVVPEGPVQTRRRLHFAVLGLAIIMTVTFYLVLGLLGAVPFLWRISSAVLMGLLVVVVAGALTSTEVRTASGSKTVWARTALFERSTIVPTNRIWVDVARVLPGSKFAIIKRVGYFNQVIGFVFPVWGSEAVQEQCEAVRNPGEGMVAD